MADDYPLLAEDLAALNTHLDQRRQEIRNKADQNQRLFYGTQIAVLIGGVVLVSLGALQGTMFQESLMLAWINAGVGFFLGLLVLAERELRFQKRWLKATKASEQMKQERFRFLGRVGDYATDDPVRVLRRRVNEIEEELNKPD